MRCPRSPIRPREARAHTPLFIECHTRHKSEPPGLLRAASLFSLTTPTAVTGVKPRELDFLRDQFEKVVHPEAAEERPLTLQALDDLDRGVRNAINKICQSAGVKADEVINADAEPVGEAAYTNHQGF